MSLQAEVTRLLVDDDVVHLEEAVLLNALLGHQLAELRQRMR